MSREKLATRRAGASWRFTLNRVEYHALVNYFDDGRPAEIFLNAGKPGTDVNVAARDAAIAASLCLQHGCSVDTLLEALTQSPVGGPKGELAPDGPLGIALTELKRIGGGGDA